MNQIDKVEGDLICTKFPDFDKWDKKHTENIYFKYSEDSKVRKFAIYASFFGDPRLWAPTLIILGIYGLVIWDTTLVMTFFLGFIQSYVIYYIIKHKIVKRHRPFIQHDGIDNLDKTGHGYSFPSGHVHHSIILIGLIWLEFIPLPWFIIVLFIYNFIVAYSRLVSGCHYIFDTIFAVLEGYIALFFYWFVCAEFYINIYLRIGESILQL